MGSSANDGYKFDTSTKLANAYAEHNQTKPLNYSDVSGNPGKSSKNRVSNKLGEVVDPIYDYVIYVDEINKLINNMNKSINYNNETTDAYFNRTVGYYNRFKMPSLNEAFTKGFAHVFITRPNCNIKAGKPDGLTESVGMFKQAWDRNEHLVYQLQKGMYHQFMYSLSNKVISFSPNDEYIGTETYGKTWGGYRTTIGRTNVESKSASELNITFKDDRDLNVYTIIKLWCEYISGVYRGEYEPDINNIYNKILDYASSIYYIITAEDGETIIFWSKYYGTFPSTVPTTQFAWAAGNVIDSSSVNIDVKFNYSFKEDCNPETIREFNYCNGNNYYNNKPTSFTSIYNENYGHTGDTWQRRPYIIREDNRFKLKFFNDLS